MYYSAKHNRLNHITKSYLLPLLDLTLSSVLVICCFAILLFAYLLFFEPAKLVELVLDFYAGIERIVE